MARTETEGRTLMRPRESASGDYKGEPFVVNPSELYDGDHPLVKNYPHLFQEAQATRPNVERATRAPGEKRGD